MKEQILQWLDQEVFDPEIPVLSVIDMGVVREVEQVDGHWRIHLTPTYTGCPAMDVIGREIKNCLVNHGLEHVEILEVLSPAWTTDWLSEKGREKLEEYGIAPPVNEGKDKRALFVAAPVVKCPRCKSENTLRISQYGSTACKAMYKCNECQEPFDYFKCL